MVVDLWEEEDAVTDATLVAPALEPGQAGICPHLLAAAAGTAAAGLPA